jgi:hypothetical protein
MSDFFSALAARVVQRPGERAASPVRPRLPALFETAPGGFSEDWGERADPAAAARPPLWQDASPPPQPAASPRLAAPIEAAAPTATSAAPQAWAEPPASSAPTASHAAPPTEPATPLRAGQAAPAAEIALAPAETTLIEVTEVRRAASAAPAEARVAPAPVGAEPEAAVVRLASPQAPPPVAIAAPKIAQGAPPRPVEPPAPAPETTIEVAIGRVEVRATPAAPDRRSAAARSPVMSLEDYLQSRTGRPPR